MPRLSVDELYDLAHRHGAYAGPDACVVAGVLHESGGVTDVKAAGDEDSWGLFQMNRGGGMGAGYSVAQLCDPDFAAAIMVPLYVANYERGQQRGYQGEQLARWTYMSTEKPYGWTADDPGLDSAAANDFAAHWRSLQEAPMPATRTYDPETPSVLQTDAWSCSVASTAWALRALGIDTPYPGLEGTFIGAGLATPNTGLLSASGQPLAAWLRQTYGLTVEVNSDADWGWILERAGRGPILLGGRHWGGEGHWSGCRGPSDDGGLLLANPAPGWGSVWGTLYEGMFGPRGGWTAIYIQAESGAEEVTQEEYDALQAQFTDLKTYTDALTGAILPSALGAMEAAAGTTKTKLAQVVREQCQAVRDAAGL